MGQASPHVPVERGDLVGDLSQIGAALEAMAPALRRQDQSPKQFEFHDAHAKQREFLALTELEALYGGAAGGGKSDALLMAALQHVHVPGYRALLLRRTYPALNLPGAIMDRAHDWLDGTAAHWDDQDKRWTFPSGAILQFGYCDAERDLDRYKGAEFHFIGIDEVTEWPEPWYLFLFSRLRRVVGFDVAMRMRAATNPDGLGAEWVRERFGIPEDTVVTENIQTTDERVFMPARAEDNPSLDLEAYELSLSQLGPVRYQQLRFGRWLRDAGGLVYSIAGRHIIDIAPACSRYVLAIDYGFNDSTAFVVFGWRENDPTTFALMAEKRTGLTPGKAAERVQELQALYAFEAIVGDTGGLGKGYVEEARSRFQLPIEAAEKNNKRGYIELLNGALESDQLRFVRGACEPLLEEARKLPWDKERKLPAAGFEDHACDAMLYGWRRARAYYEKPPTPQAAESTIAALNRTAAEHKARYLKSLKARRPLSNIR